MTCSHMFYCTVQRVGLAWTETRMHKTMVNQPARQPGSGTWALQHAAHGKCKRTCYPIATRVRNRAPLTAANRRGLAR